MAIFFSIMNGHLFSMQSSKMVMPPFCNNFTILDKYTSNQWIGPDLASTLFGNSEGAVHVRLLLRAPSHDCG
jgi:hypothetical protein